MPCIYFIYVTEENPTKLDRYYYYPHFTDKETEVQRANLVKSLNPLRWSAFPVTRSKFLPNGVVTYTEKQPREEHGVL